MSSPLDGLPGGVIALSGGMELLAANRTLADLVGRPTSELIGESIDVLLSQPSRILFQTHVYPALKAEGHVEEVFLTLLASDGQTVPVLMNAVRSPDDPSRFDALLVRIRARSRWEADLLAATKAIERERAASQQLAEELRAAATELETRYAEEQRNREFRDAFIGVVSHELRTPITTIYGMSHLLRERHRALDDETMEQYLADIEGESDRLRRLTEDLLVLSRAEGGQLVVAADPLVIGHIVRRAVDSEQARAADHQLALELEPGLPLVLGEELYVGQVVRNFLSNAVKYSRKGTTIRVSVRSEGGGVAVRVRDEGPGLGTDPPERLFDLFYRAPAAVAKSAGAGIGLFVSRELVEAMGGRIWAAPAERGAEFGFWLPAGGSEADEG